MTWSTDGGDFRLKRIQMKIQCKKIHIYIEMLRLGKRHMCCVDRNLSWVELSCHDSIEVSCYY